MSADLACFTCLQFALHYVPAHVAHVLTSHWAAILLLGNLTGSFACRDKSDKLLIGLNFYGMDFDLSGGGSAIVGHEYLARLKRYRPKLAWNATAKEHSFEYVTNGKGHRVYYPTLASIQMRLDYAENMGAGVSIWEIGQGLEFFYDLL